MSFDSKGVYMELLEHVFIHTVNDTIRMLPFLFVAFLLLEALEHYSSSWIRQTLIKLEKAGPIVGALFGCIPQCGFSVMAANLYAGGVVSLGTLLAVFLATSDEALLILMAHPGYERDIFFLLIVKVIIAVIAGYLADIFFARFICTKKEIGDLCHHCGCHDHHGIIRPALNHTVKLFAYIFVFTGILTFIIEAAGLESVSSFLLQGSIFQPFLAALLGFIPNCAASVLLTELYLGGALSFASVIAGLCTNAGIGLIVLFKVNGSKKECLKFVVLLYAAAVISGILLHLAGL